MNETTKPMNRRAVVLSVVLAATLWSCSAPDLSQEPLWFEEETDNVLLDLRRQFGSIIVTASKFECDLAPEKNQVLKVSGRIRRAEGRAGGGTIGPADFVVEIDGRQVASNQLRSHKDHESFEYRIDLDDFAGQEVRAVFRQKNHDPDQTEASWKSISVLQRRKVKRQLADEGLNVLFLMVDTVRSDHCSLNGYERQTTPNLDRLAVDSLVFDRAIAPAAWTLPSVASMLTGKFSIKMRAVDGIGLRSHDTTLAEVLNREGWTTAAVSSNPLIAPSHAFDQGFETFIEDPWARAEGVNEHFFDWLDGAEGTRWFAYLHYIDPHDPYDAPRPFRGEYADPDYAGPFTEDKALIQLSNTVNFGLEAPFPFGEEDLAYLRDRYDEEIRYWDSCLGRLMEELESRDLMDRTVIVVVSDHGEEFGDHGKFKHGKHLYEETIHVPLVVRIPGSDLVGRRRDSVETRLLMSSMLQLFSIKRPVGVRGNIFSLHEVNNRVVTYTRYTVRPDDPRSRLGLVAQMRGPWKLISETDVPGDVFFNLNWDPVEQRPIEEKDSEAYEQQREALDRWLQSHPRPPMARSEISEETIEDLRALGYVQ